MELHKLLQRQIKKYLSFEASQDPAFSKFINAISDSYNSFDRDKELTTHSFKMSEIEYQEVNTNLLNEINLRKISIQKLKEAIRNLDYGSEINLDPDDLLNVVDYLNEEIKRRKEVEEKLLDLSIVSEETSNMVIITDAERKILWVNKAFTKTSGYTLDDVKGKSPGSLLQGARTDKNTINEIKVSLAAGQSFHGTLLNYNKDGEKYWNELSINPIYDGAGKISKFISISTDVTERITKNEELLKSELKWKFAMEGSGGGMFEYDVAKKQFSGSENLKVLLGLSMDLPYLEFEELIDFIHPRNRENKLAAFADFLSGKEQIFIQEFDLKNASEEYVSILVKAIITKIDADGRPLSVLGTTTDITEIKKTEVELANRVRQFKGLSENIPAVIYEYQFNSDGTEGFRYISPAMEKVFGLAGAEFMENSMAYLHPEDRERIVQKNKKARETLLPFFDESRLVIPGRGIVWQSVSSSYTYKTSAGDLVYTGIITDITGEKKAEEALKLNEEKYRSIITNMKLGLLEMDVDEAITYANNAFCEMSGFSLHELVDKKTTDLFFSSASNEADAYEISVCDKNGRYRWWFVSRAQRRNDVGNLVGYVGIYLDISDQKNLEMNLVQAREEAIQQAKTKETFLANMSHEIRTPLNGIIGMIRELGKMEPTGKQKIYIANAAAASQHLLSIINNILDPSKIEAGVFDLERKSFSLANVFSEVENMMKTSIMDKMLKTRFVLEDDLAKRFIGDPSRIRQILLNVISNAVKFTERGHVWVDCKVNETFNTSQSFTITVEDSGIGMDEVFLKTIFSKFTQENDSTQRKYGGTGLGMAITHELIQLMGGAIRVTSKKGEGSKFDISLAIDIDVDATQEESDAVDYKGIFAGKKVFLVEDNEMNRMVALNILNHYLMVSDVAGDGLEAISILEKRAFDIILMDLQMPRMDGFEATKAIRKMGITTPIIALTANAFKSEIDKCLSIGMNDFVTKPFDEEYLLSVIHRNIIKENSKFSNIAAQKKTEINEPLYDLKRLQEASHGNKQFLIAIVGIFYKQIPEFLKTVDDAIREENWHALDRVIHKMKPGIIEMGISGIVGDLNILQVITSSDQIDHSSVDKIRGTLSCVAAQLEAEFFLEPAKSQ